MPKRVTPGTSDPRDTHGVMRLPGLSIDSYNLAIREPDGSGFVGDRASQTAFRRLLEKARKHDRTGKDPFGRQRTDGIGKKAIDLVMVGGDPDAAHLVHVAVEEYARRLAGVVRCFLAQPEWEGVEGIVLGGGLPESGFGGLAIRRAARVLKEARVGVDLEVLQHDPDEGGLLGWVHLLPGEVRKRHDAFLAVDVGGTNLRCGIVEHRLDKEKDGSKARLLEHMQWRHADDDPDRGEALARLAGMLNGLNAQARTLGIALAPFVGVACPGLIQPDGGIPQGAQNLPGDWETPFNLPRELRRRLDRIDGHRPRRRAAQRCGGAGPQCARTDAQDAPLGRADYRHGPGQRELYQSLTSALRRATRKDSSSSRRTPGSSLFSGLPKSGITSLRLW